MVAEREREKDEVLCVPCPILKFATLLLGALHATNCQYLGEYVNEGLRCAPRHAVEGDTDAKGLNERLELGLPRRLLLAPRHLPVRPLRCVR